MTLIPPPEGWHIAPTNPDGTLQGRLDPKEQEKRAAKLKSDMEKYQARTREGQEKLLKSAAGVKKKVEAPPPTDELGLIEMNFLAYPALLQGKGAVPLQVLTEEQKRARQRAALDAQAAEARKDLNTFLKSDDDNERDSHEGLRLGG